MAEFILNAIWNSLGMDFISLCYFKISPVLRCDMLIPEFMADLRCYIWKIKSN